MTTSARILYVPAMVLAALISFNASVTAQDEHGGTPRLILVPVGVRTAFDSVDSHALIVDHPRADGGPQGIRTFGNQDKVAIATAIAGEMGEDIGDSDELDWIVDFVYESLNRTDVYQVPTVHVTSDGFQQTSILIDTRGGFAQGAPPFVVPTGPHGKVLVLGKITAYAFNQSDLYWNGYCPDQDEPGYDYFCGAWTLGAPEFDLDSWRALAFYVAIGWCNQ